MQTCALGETSHIFPFTKYYITFNFIFFVNKFSAQLVKYIFSIIVMKRLRVKSHKCIVYMI